jgi:hypothetical protein
VSVPTTDSNTPEPKDLRDQTWFRIAVVLGLLLVIFAASRSCQREGLDISQEEAIEIAKQEVDFEPDDFQVRLLRQGVNFSQRWVVGLWELQANGERFNEITVVIDASSGDVVQIIS